MIYCVKCGGASADGAVYCQTCGHRLGDPPPAPVQIEATAKRWKLAQLRGMIYLAVAAAMIGFSVIAQAHAPSVLALLILCGGVAVGVLGLAHWLYGRYGQWWHHE